ncbi:MAG: sirohydrochlorin cobaltochelatase [Deltaproteobacteria bacterium]|jgi:sirohydrochlorin cobaltochelatase|nr:sirohydrochlorin cobaltochelatase [Deltaproteobacteria bacterium]
MKLVNLLKKIITGQARAYERPPRPPAIILAAFGTTHPGALPALENIETRVKKAFPDYEVRLAFTSNHIRDRWHQRANDPEYRKEHPGVGERFFRINNVLSQLAHFQEYGARLILVQSLLVADGEEFGDLKNLIGSLKELDTGQRSLHPFPWLGLGPPALGLGRGTKESLDRAAASLSSLGDLADSGEAAVVFMAHGNERFDLPVFGELEKTLRSRYGQDIFIGMVEGHPSLEEVRAKVASAVKPGRHLVLAPLMVVAGDHALNDLAGGDDSWVICFRQMGYNVSVSLKGLGSLDGWADIYVESLRQVEREVLAEKAKEENFSEVA